MADLDRSPPLVGQDDSLLSRIEDAGLNASAPPQQRWIDGWLVRFSPGKAQRARCIQAVADGRLPLDDRLAVCAALFAQAGLPMLARLTPFSRPAGLDAALADRGWQRIEDTRVMVMGLQPLASAASVPAGLTLARLSHAAFAEAVGALRGSPSSQRLAHAERLVQTPVPYEGWVLREGGEHGPVLCCAQVATEADMVGLYDVFTDETARGRGLADWLCRRLLSMAQTAGARVAYLQVGADNLAARRIYQRMGFADAYGYHYRLAPGTASS